MRRPELIPAIFMTPLVFSGAKMCYLYSTAGAVDFHQPYFQFHQYRCCIQHDYNMGLQLVRDELECVQA